MLTGFLRLQVALIKVHPHSPSAGSYIYTTKRRNGKGVLIIIYQYVIKLKGHVRSNIKSLKLFENCAIQLYHWYEVVNSNVDTTKFSDSHLKISSEHVAMGKKSTGPNTILKHVSSIRWHRCFSFNLISRTFFERQP